jgi:two-component system, NtrC family, sensor kinase
VATASPKSAAPPPPASGAPAPPGDPPDGTLERLARAIAPRSLGDVGFEIPWRHRLSTRLFVMIAIVSVAAVAAFAVAEYAVQRHLFAQVLKESDLLSGTIRNALHRAMLQDRRDDAYAIMDDIGRHEGIARVRMLDAEGRITYSTDKAEIGTLVDRRAEACVACHEDAMGPLHAVDQPTRSRVFELNGGRFTGLVTPLPNEPSCSTAACHAHSPDQKVLGVVDLTLSLEALDVETQLFRWRTIAAAAAAAAVAGLLFWLFSRAYVIRPVAALVQATRRVARDQLDLEIPVRWSGEMGLLAASFNDMTRSLRATKRQLDELMHSLERQVQDRTAALYTAQEQLVRTEKLSSLGKLSASIAHEINNPLAGILTFAKLMIRTLESGPPDEAARKTLVKNLQLVQRETERCSAIVRNLLDFARERPMAVKDVSMPAVLDEVLQLVANQLAMQGVQLERRVGTLPAVSGDFGQLRQALVNVVMNACEALPRGGTLAIDGRASEDGRFVEIAIADSGPGIPPDTLSKIFDPFFTTKERGTGLGLSVVYGIVERHGGRVEVTSEVGKGTRVAIRLPVATPAPVPAGGDAPGAAGGAA